MFALIGGIRGILAAGAGALVAATLFYNVGHWRGHDAGYAAAQDEARERALELIQKRSEDNEEISDLDAAGLCAELGGEWLPVERRCD